VNIAFTTLAILLLAMPGYVARSAYLTDDFTRDVLPANWTNEIALAILYSLPFHFVGVILVTHLYLNGYLSANVNFEVLFRLLAGEYGKDGAEFPRLSNNLYQYIHRIAVYFICILLTAELFGILLRKIVWNYKLEPMALSTDRAGPTASGRSSHHHRGCTYRVGVEHAALQRPRSGVHQQREWRLRRPLFG